MAAGVALIGCATPAARIDQMASSNGLTRSEIQGTQYQHVIYQRETPKNGVLHVYIEGDGTPFFSSTEIAADPTPRRPLALELMLMDPSPSLYLGRPCYYGHASDDACHWPLWTSHRYSELVLASMASALTTLITKTATENVILIGYSGGGTLAVLLAKRVPQTRAVITLSANLDIDAWTSLHDYTALTGSLNPAREPSLPTSIPQWHLVGRQDTTVPPWITRRGSAQQPASQIIEYAEADHSCCWTRIWPSALAHIKQTLLNPTAE